MAAHFGYEAVQAACLGVVVGIAWGFLMSVVRNR